MGQAQRHACTAAGSRVARIYCNTRDDGAGTTGESKLGVEGWVEDGRLGRPGGRASGRRRQEQAAKVTPPVKPRDGSASAWQSAKCSPTGRLGQPRCGDGTRKKIVRRAGAHTRVGTTNDTGGEGGTTPVASAQTSLDGSDGWETDANTSTGAHPKLIMAAQGCLWSPQVQSPRALLLVFCPCGPSA